MHGKREAAAAVRADDAVRGGGGDGAALARLRRQRGDVEHAPDGVRALEGHAAARHTSLAHLFTLLSGELGRELHEWRSLRAYHRGGPNTECFSRPATRWPAPRRERA